jgi:hypothetical protein
LEWLGNFFSRCFQEQPDRSREPIEIIIIIIIIITNEVLPSLSLMSYTTPPLKREREEKKVKKQKKKKSSIGHPSGMQQTRSSNYYIPEQQPLIAERER